MMQNISEETITHRHSMRDTAAPVRQYGSFLPGSGVGGAGEHWNGAAWRFLPGPLRSAHASEQKYGKSKLSPISLCRTGASPRTTLNLTTGAPNR